MIIVNPSTRQFTIPGSDLVFGVTADSGSEIKHFQCPRYVGNNLDIASSFVRINYRNANGETDFYLVEDLAVVGDNVTFSWELSPRVTAYKGQIKFVLCVVGPDLKVKWHTTTGTGQVHEGLEPEQSHVEDETADVVAQLIAMVGRQTATVEKVGADQTAAVRVAATAAQTSAVAEIEAKGTNTRNSIPADYTALSAAVDSIARVAAPGIVCEAAGSTVVVNDTSDRPLRGLRIFGKSTQDGTPTPDDPVEIKSVEKPAVTVYGKNLIVCPYLNGTSRNGITAVNAENGGILVSGTASAYAEFVIFGGYNDNAHGFKSAMKISGGSGNVRVAAFRYDDDGKYINVAASKGQPVLVEPSKGICVTFSVSANAVVNEIIYPMLYAENASDDFEAYKPAQNVNLAYTIRGIPVASGGNYTDEKGQQWICDEVDLERGVYVQRVKRVVLDGVNIQPFYATHTDNGQPYCALYPNDLMKYSHVLSSSYRRVPTNWSNSNNHIYCVGNSIVVNDNRFTNAEAAKTLWATEKPTIQYILATPIEIPLSENEIAAYRSLHSNKPNTTILNSVGAYMSVEYTADTKLYIDKKIKEALQ